MLMRVVNVREFSGGMEQAIGYIHGIWGSDKNYPFYRDAILHSSLPGKALPQFYLLLKEDGIIGCAALVTNDFISRHDLYPWLACLYVEKSERGQAYGRLLLEHAAEEARKAGFSALYLTTDHDGYYERYGWLRIEDGIDLFSCEPSRIYVKAL